MKWSTVPGHRDWSAMGTKLARKIESLPPEPFIGTAAAAKLTSEAMPPSTRRSPTAFSVSRQTSSLVESPWLVKRQIARMPRQSSKASVCTLARFAAQVAKSSSVCRHEMWPSAQSEPIAAQVAATGDAGVEVEGGARRIARRRERHRRVLALPTDGVAGLRSELPHPVGGAAEIG